MVALITGVVTSCTAAPGRVVSRGELLAQIMNVDEPSVVFSADGEQYPFLHTGQKVRVTQPGFPDRPLEATIRFLAPAVDTANGRLRVKAKIEDPDHRLKPGMGVQVDLQLYREEDLPR